jgi:imidazolonepropionase-like amidohydrolase
VLASVATQIENLRYGRLKTCATPSESPSLSAFFASLRLSYVSAIVFLLCGSFGPIYADTLLLTGATVHTVSGEVLSPADVLVENGKIAGVGTNLNAPSATKVDLSGLHVYPGLISLDTALGLTEIEAVHATADNAEVGDFTPDVESWIAVSPDSELIPVARANGIACFEPAPAGGLVPGQSGLVLVEGWTTEQRTIKKPAALHVIWPTMELEVAPRGRGRRGGARPKSLDEQAKERRAKVREVMDFFEEAKAYAKAKEAGGKGNTPAPQKVPAWEAMLPYVRSELPIMVHADEVRQIRSAVSWAVTNHYKMILAGGRDADLVAGLLASNNIPVVFTETYLQPVRDTESYDVHFGAPEVLHEAGVKVAFSVGPRAFDASSVRNQPYSAAQAVAFGLPPAEALKGLTLYPAQFMGIADRLGSIEPGKDATFFAADGDILDIRSQVKRMWVGGKEISLESRHTRLYQKYKSRPKPE